MRSRSALDRFLCVWQRTGDCALLAVAVAVVVPCLFLLGNAPSRVSGAAAHVVESFALGNSSRNVLVFAQITDSHISIVKREHEQAFREFVHKELPVLHPRFTLHTGDICDGKSGRFYLSHVDKQHESEWDTYKAILVEHGLWESDAWVDVAGNHDAGGVLSPGDPNDLRSRFISWAPARGSSPAVLPFVAEQDEVRLRLLVLNVASFPGLVFNYVGKASDGLVRAIRRELTRSSEFTHTLLAGHFCSSWMLSPSFRPFSALIGGDGIQYTAHLCGHNHVAEQYSRSGCGHLEAELGSMKRDNWMRVAACDNGVFTFVDRTVGSWPAILVTNPKDARFLTEADPLRVMQTSTHIRALVFHNESVVRVASFVDGELICPSMNRSQSSDLSLFTCRWSPEVFATGLHTLRVEVTDGSQRTSFAELQFSLDGTPSMNRGLASTILSADFLQWLLALLVLAIAFSTGYLLVMPLVFRLLLLLLVNPSARQKLEQLLDGDRKRCSSLALLLALPFLATMHTMWKLPLAAKIGMLAFGVLPLALPIAYGDLGPDRGRCVTLPWGWSYCQRGARSFEMLPIAHPAVYFFSVYPLCVISVASCEWRLCRGNTAWIAVAEATLLGLAFCAIVATTVGEWVTFYGIPALLSPFVWTMFLLFFGSILFCLLRCRKARRDAAKREQVIELGVVQGAQQD